MEPMIAGMTAEQARRLAGSLRRIIRTRETGAKLVLRARVEGEGREAAIVFYGGTTGEHSLWLSATDRARALAHWAGYVEAHGRQAMPVVGMRVRFPSASAWREGGYRTGTVTRVGLSRVTIAFTYKNGRPGAPVERAVADLLF